MKPVPIAFLFDVDNTLLDNDRVIENLRSHLEADVGPRAARYWDIFEQLRADLGYADYLGALQRYRSEYPRDLGILAVSRFMLNYPFSERLYPLALQVVKHVKQWGPAALLSDGDVVFQPHKTEMSGLAQAVDERVLIYVHKELELEDVAERLPSAHYVLVDDKIRILTAVKKIWGARVTTVFVRQGHYALDRETVSRYPAADVSVDRVGDLLNYSLPALSASAPAR